MSRSTRNSIPAGNRMHRLGSIRRSLRRMNLEMSLFNHRIGRQLELNDVALSALNVIASFGAVSPSSLARRSGFHPATTTGILDRLERRGWIVRERIASDRRAVLVRFRRHRSAELRSLFAGINASMREICLSYDDAALELIADFLDRTAAACREAADQLPER